MSSSSKSSDSSDEELTKKKQDTSDSEESDLDSRVSRNKRSSRSTKKTIESAGSSESDSEEEEKSKFRKGKATKRVTSKRKRDSSDSSDGNGVDDSLFADAEDKARWKALSEREKEQEIFERMEARESQRTREEIAQQLEAKKAQKEKKSKNDKRKKMASSSEDSDRSKSSPPNKSKKSSESDSDMEPEFHRPSDINRKHKEKNAMAELRMKRKEMEKKNAAKSASLSIDAVFGARTSGSSSSSSSSASSRSSSSSRESSPDNRIISDDKEDKKDVEFLGELVRARLSRFKLCKMIHAPFFKSAVVGCYVRVGMGAMGGAQNKYKLWQIGDVIETPKVYEVEGKRTNKGLKCKHGKQERIFRVAFVSNSEFTASEFEEWLQTMKNESTVPNMDHIEKKEADIKKAINHKYTNTEIDELIKEKGRFNKVPRNFAMTKGDLANKKAIAQQAGDFREAERIQKEIDEIERKADDLDKKRSLDISAIAYINHRNRNKNKDEFLSGRVKIEESTQDDPFTRKKGGMKVVSGSKSRTEPTTQEAKIEAPKEPVVKMPEPPKPSPVKAKKKSTNMFDLHNSATTNLDFNIDIDKLVNSKSSSDNVHGEAASSSHSATLTSGETRGRGMSLAEYRLRRAAASGGTGQ